MKVSNLFNISNAIAPHFDEKYVVVYRIIPDEKVAKDRFLVLLYEILESIHGKLSVDQKKMVETDYISYDQRIIFFDYNKKKFYKRLKKMFEEVATSSNYVYARFFKDGKFDGESE